MALRAAIFKSLNIKQEEEKKFTFLFFHSFFLGLFIAFYFLSANSVFIEHFESQDLPYAYIAAGIIGYIVSLIYTFLQSKVNSKTLFLSTLVFMSVIPLISRLFVEFLPEKWMSFFVFLWAWPFISLVSTESGGLALKKLDLRQVKRLYGLINSGGVAASILTYLSVPFLLKLFSSSFDILALSSVGTVVSIIILIYIYKNFPDKTETNRKETQTERAGIRMIFKDRYLSLLFVSAFFSIISIYLIDFGFLSGVKVQGDHFPTAESISNFFALIFSGLKVIELLTSIYSGRWLARYGIKLGLAALPVTLFSLMIFATMSGFTWGTKSLLMFSILILSKAAERFIRRSLEDPAFNVLYQPLPQQQQLVVQTRVGMVIQFSVAIAGALLLLINLLLNGDSGFSLEYFPLILLPIFGTWLFIAFRLYKQYRTKLRQVLRDESKEMAKGAYRYRYGDETLRRKLKPFNKYVTRLASIILAESNPRQLQRYAVPLLAENDPIVTPSLLKSITPSFPAKALRVLDSLDTDQLPVEAEENLLWTKKCLQKDTFKVKNETDMALFWLKEKRNYDDTRDLNRLLELMDAGENKIRRVAIEVAGTVADKRVVQKMIELLEEDSIRNYVADIITESSLDVFDELDKLFRRTQSNVILQKIIEIWAKIGTAQARLLLLRKMYYPDRDVQMAAINGLHFCRFEADESNQDLVVKKIQEVIASILWITVCMKDTEDKLNTLKLQQSLELDKDENYELLFNLLGFLYTPSTIELIRRNIIGENVIFALEIIENFMSSEIKQLIVPLFENISVSQKLKRLEHIVKVEKKKFSARLQEIVISDFHILNDWTRAKAIELIGRLHKRKKNTEKGRLNASESNEIDLWTEENVTEVLDKIKKSEMPDEIFVCLYHPNELVYSTSSKIIYDESPTRCLNYIKTLASEKQFLRDVFEGGQQDMLLTDRLKNIKRHLLFFNIPERTLVKIAEVLQPMKFNTGETINLNVPELKDHVILVMNGVLESPLEEVKKVFKKNDIILKGINLPEASAELIVKKKAHIFHGLRSQYFNLLMDDTDIIHHMFEDL